MTDINLVDTITNAFSSLNLGKGTSGRPPAFDGKRSVEDWISNFELATDGLKDEKKISMLPIVLKDSALTWLASESRSKTHGSWGDWKESIRTHFKKPIEAVMAELANTTWNGSADTLLDYIQNKLALCSMAEPNMGDVMKVDYLLRGVPTKFQRDLILLTPKDPTEFKTKLQVLLRAAGTQSGSGDKEIFEAFLAQIKEKVTPVPEPVLYAPEKKNDDLMARIEKLEKSARYNEQKKSGYKNGNNNFQRGYNKGGNQRKDFECFHCKKRGHYAADCYVNPNGRNYQGPPRGNGNGYNTSGSGNFPERR